MAQVDENGVHQWADVTQHEERGKEFVFEQVLVSVPGQNQKARPCLRQSARVRFVSVLINGHYSPPNLSYGKGDFSRLRESQPLASPGADTYCANSAVIVAPFICGMTAEILTTLRLSFAIQTVVLPGSFSAEVTSSLNASKLPAGTLIFSAAITFACFKSTFCFCRSKFRKVTV